MGAFRRSGVFGIVGVVVVAAITVVIALTMGTGDANPKAALALIFGVVGLFMILLFALQGRDLERAAAADVPAPAHGPGAIENPATLAEPALWAAMAVRPIDADALAARGAVWGTARRSRRLAMIVTGLIFLTVPPVYLLESFVPLLIGVPLIVGVALWESARLLATGGGLDQAYEQTARAVAPLGLDVVERPRVTIEAKSAAPFRVGPDLKGALVLGGRRLGRAVSVAMPTTDGVRAVCEVHVDTDAAAFEFKARDGRLRAERGAPAAVRDALAAVPNSTRWNGVRGSGGADGIEVRRKGVGTGDWLLDLWLAERLADAAAG